MLYLEKITKVEQITFTNELQAIKAFIKKPVQNFPQTSFANKLKAFAVVFLLSLALTMAAGAAIEWFSEMFGFRDLVDSHKLQQVFTSMPPVVVGLLVVVAIPFIEEAFFRLPLKFGRITLNFIVPIMLVGVAGMTGSAQMPALATSLILIILFFIFNSRVLNRLEKVWQYRFRWVFYGFTFLFAFIHITNYQVTWLTVALFPLLLAPQFFAGFFIGYTRLRSGFFWGAAFHMLHNGLFVIPALIAMANAFPPVNIQNNEYSLSISKSEGGGHASEFNLNHTDSLIMKNYAFKGVIAILLDKEEKMIEVDDTFTADTKLDISYGRIMAENETVPDAQNERIAKEYKSDILSEMKKAYGFALENEQQETQYYELYIKDSLKAKKHYTKAAHLQSSQVFVGFTETKLTKVTVEQLTEILGEQYGSVYFDSDIDETFLFTLEFKKMPIEELESYFEEHFGLGFTKSTKKVEMTKVVLE